MSVPNVHLRGLSPRLHERLRERAALNGRSLNAELLAILERELGQDVDRVELMRRIRKLRREVRLSPGATPSEQIIREARDERHGRP